MLLVAYATRRRAAYVCSPTRKGPTGICATVEERRFSAASDGFWSLGFSPGGTSCAGGHSRVTTRAEATLYSILTRPWKGRSSTLLRT